MDGEVAYNKAWRHAIRREKMYMPSWRPPAHLRHIQHIAGRVQHGILGAPELEPDAKPPVTVAAPTAALLAERLPTPASPGHTAPPGQLAPLGQTALEHSRSMPSLDMRPKPDSWLKVLPQKAPRGMERARPPSGPCPQGPPPLWGPGARKQSEAQGKAEVLRIEEVASVCTSRSSQHSMGAACRSQSTPNLAPIDENRSKEVPMPPSGPPPPGALANVTPPGGWEHTGRGPPPSVAPNRAAAAHQRFGSTVQFQGRVRWVV